MRRIRTVSFVAAGCGMLVQICLWWFAYINYSAFIIAAWISALSLVGGVIGLLLCAVIGSVRWYRSWVRGRIPPGHCRECGYDLRVQIELHISKCPECGTVVAEAP
jgi:hypothetical protein